MFNVLTVSLFSKTLIKYCFKSPLSDPDGSAFQDNWIDVDESGCAVTFNGAVLGAVWLKIDKKIYIGMVQWSIQNSKGTFIMYNDVKL